MSVGIFINAFEEMLSFLNTSILHAVTTTILPFAKGIVRYVFTSSRNDKLSETLSIIRPILTLLVKFLKSFNVYTINPKINKDIWKMNIFKL